MWPNTLAPGGVSEYRNPRSRDTAGYTWASRGPGMPPIASVETPGSVLILQMQQIVHRLEMLEQHMAEIVKKMEARSG